MAPRGVLVTGTDTGVGKTVTAAALARCWTDAGRATVYVKPVQSGAADGDDDAADVAALAGAPTVVGPVIGPSLAPGVAVRRAGEALDLAELVAVVHGATRDHPGAHVIVEGAGGLLVELTAEGATAADLARATDLPIVVVVRPGLGTLNHTALTLEAITRRGLTFVGIVICGYPADPDLAELTNGAELQRLSGQRLAGVVPELDRGRPLPPTTGWFGPQLGGNWDPAAWLAAQERDIQA